MPSMCCAPGCQSNAKGTPYVRCFSFPKTDPLKSKWLRIIPRDDLVISKNTNLCCLHFVDDDIVKTYPYGGDRKVWTLQLGALPSKFPNLPNYFSKEPSKPRTDPNKRKDAAIDRFNNEQEEWLSMGKINSLSDIENGKDKYNILSFQYKLLDSGIIFYKICFEKNPKVCCSFIITNSLDVVEVFIENHQINVRNFQFLLGNKFKCDSFPKLENLLVSVSNFEPMKVTLNSRIAVISEEISFIQKDEKANDKIKSILNFLREQLHLITLKSPRYTADQIVLSALFFFNFPAAYRYIRELDIIFLPHPNYLKTFSIGDCKSGIINESYILNLKKHLQGFDKYVNLCLDEIYVTPTVTYKANKIEGYAGNTNQKALANTVQTFMITSILSSNKQVVGLYPVHKLDASFLHSKTLEILDLLTRCDFEVVSIISDNNQVNRKLFKILCGGGNDIRPYFINPSNKSKKIFILFDSVHLLKSIRNNWITDRSQTFKVPNFDNCSEVITASIRSLKTVYDLEKHKSLKMAPSLSRKVLFPSNFEKQNVYNAVNLFNEKTIEALLLYAPDFECLADEFVGTSKFLSIINNWWSVVNVKNCEKGKHKRDYLQDPIRSETCSPFLFLIKFFEWLQEWDKLDVPSYKNNHPHKLTPETMSALKQTVSAYIPLCHHLLFDLGFRYVLLGKFQTDPLERRFGKYRRMSGCNYHVSVQQILESERKINITKVLKFFSHQKGAFSLKQFLSTFVSDSDKPSSDCLIPIENIEEILEDSTLKEVDSQTINTLIYVAGYVGRKVGEFYHCNDLSCNCPMLLTSSSNLEAEFDENCIYLENLSRGGLKYPSPLGIEIGICSYQIFESLMSEKFESMFLKSDNHKLFLFTLIFERLEFDEELRATCGNSYYLMIKKAISTWCNILLNNYSKNSRDLLKGSDGIKKRKLLTVQNK